MLKIKRLTQQEPVYDITVQDNHNFYANGIVVHNCQEITLPTKPLQDLHDEQGLIALCTLSAINWGKFKNPSEMKNVCRLAVRALNNLLDYQSYPVKAAEVHSKYYRPLGIGIINLAYFFAKNGVKYGDQRALDLAHEYMEAQAYYLTEASVELAEELGQCPASADGHLKYSSGIVPYETSKADARALVTRSLSLDWDSLIARMKVSGIYNSTLMAQMPAETSAQIANATNGIEQIRSFVTKKTNKDGNFVQVAPDSRKLRKQYDLLWNNANSDNYLKVAAVLQLFMDQSISTNTSYNPKLWPNNKIPMSELMTNLLNCYKWGLKTLYYFNTYDGQEEVNIEELISDQENTTIEDEICTSCVI